MIIEKGDFYYACGDFVGYMKNKNSKGKVYYEINIVQKKHAVLVVKENRRNCPICSEKTIGLWVKSSDRKSFWISKCINKQCGQDFTSLKKYLHNSNSLSPVNMSEVKDWLVENRNNDTYGLGVKFHDVNLNISDLAYVVSCDLVGEDYPVSYKIFIVKDIIEPVRMEERIFLPISNNFAQIILSSIANNISNVNFLNVKYVIQPKCIRYDAIEVERYKDKLLNCVRKVESNEDNPIIIYVYSSLNNVCDNYSHEIESVTVYATNRLNGRQCQLNVYYCHTCDRYYVDRTSLKNIISEYQVPTVMIYYMENDSNNMQGKSILKLFGYSAQENGPSRAKRQKILSFLMDNKILSKKAIDGYLSFFITFNGKKDKMENAVDIWKEDLDFIRNYKIQDQRVIHGFYVFKFL